MKKSFLKRAVKKLAAATVMSAMLVGTLTGCGGSKKEEVITLTVFSERANYSGEQMGWTAKYLLDNYNVKLNIVPNTDGAFNTRTEAGDLGDIVVFGSEKDFMKSAKNGLLFDWEEDNVLADYGTYMKDNCSLALEKVREMNGDGKIYGVPYEVAPTSDNLQSFLYTWDIRWDLYEQLGHPEVKNLDDYIQLFKDMKELCPTDEAGKPTYAFSLWPDWDGNMVMYVKSFATAYYGYDEFQIGLYDPATGNFHGALEENGPYLEMAKFFHDLYVNDLLDPASMTATYDSMSEKMKKGGVFASIFNYAGYMLYNTDDHVSQNKMMKSLRPSDASPIVYGLNTLGGNNYWAIGAKTEYPELCMELINFFYTPEGAMFGWYGPKGVTWDYDEDGYTYFTELGKKTNFDKSTPMEGDYAGSTYHDGECQINMTSWSQDCNNPDSNGETYNYIDWKSEQGEPACDAEADWRSFTGCTSINEYMRSGKYTVSPGTAYVDKQVEGELETTWNNVTNCITTGTWKAIYAKDDAEFDSIVADMIKQANDYGYDKCLEWSLERAKERKAAEDAVSK